MQCVAKVLTLCQDALHSVSQDNGSPLHVKAVQQLGRLDRGHPLSAGTLHEVHYLQGVVRPRQLTEAHHLGVREEAGRIEGELTRTTPSDHDHDEL